MTETTCIVLSVVACLVVLGVVALGAVALWLGRSLRAEGRAVLDGKHEFAVVVEVPEARRTNRAMAKALTPPHDAAS
jgi:hypothetical protein